MRTFIYTILTAVILAGLGVTEIWAQSYNIGPGDVLEISVWRDENLTRQVVVPPDNVISFPLAGDIDVSGTSVPQLRQKLAAKLKAYIPDPSVTVMLKDIRSLKGYVIGKVNKPGAFDIGLETSVMQILAMAEGLNPFASESKIHILRQQGGTTVKIPFDYGSVVSGRNLEQNILLKRGDVVVVP
jgi:polysaccharide export outer membrane protein